MPFLAPVAAWVATTLAAGGVNALLLRVGISVVIGAASAAIQRRKSAGNSAADRRKGQMVTATGTLASRRLIYGKQRVGGEIVFMHSYTPSSSSFEGKKYLDVIVVIAANRCKSIGAIYFDDVLAVDDDSDEGRGKYEGLVLVERALGGETQSAFPKLREALPSKWKDTDRLRGLAAVRIRLKYDENVLPGQLPNITFDVEGNDQVLDPRTGTRGYTTNAALCVADYMAHPHYGWNTPIGDARGINEDTLIESANICDELVSLVSWKRRYTCNGVVDLDDARKDILTDMLTSCAGTVSSRGGEWYIFAGAYRTPVADFTDDDVVNGGLRLTTRISRAQNFNAVRGAFNSPENDWLTDEYPPYKSSTYRAEDGGEQVFTEHDLPFTTSSNEAQRLAKIYLERNRRQLTVAFTGKLSCLRATVGDTVTLTHAHWGFDQKLFVVHQVRMVTSDETSLLVEMTLRETSPLIYDWSATEEQIYAASPRTDLALPIDMLAPGITSVVESLYDTRSSQGVKARATVSWSEGDGFARTYRLQGKYRSGSWRQLTETSNTSQEIDDIAPGDWLFRVRSVSTTGYTSDWSDTWAATITGLTAPPVAMTNVTIQSAGGLAILTWDLATDLDVLVGGRVIVRHSSSAVPAMKNSTSLVEASGNSTVAVVPLMPGTYLLAFRDGSGNYGPVSMVTVDGVQALAFTGLDMIQEDDEFSGTHDGTFVIDGRLMIGSDTDIWSVDDVWSLSDVWTVGGDILASATYVFASGLDLGAVQTVRLRREVEIIGVNLNDDIWAVEDVWALDDAWQASTELVDARVEIATTNDDPSGTPVWSDWQRLDSAEITARGVKARAILTTTNATTTPVVTKLRVYADGVA